MLLLFANRKRARASKGSVSITLLQQNAGIEAGSKNTPIDIEYFLPVK
jgi:hypothetical protein